VGTPGELGIVELLLSEEAIAGRVRELGSEVSARLDLGATIAVVALKGAIVFAADLLRRLPPVAAVDYVQARSYGDAAESSGAVALLRDIELPVDGRNVLLIDDIADTGLTCAFLEGHLRSKGAAEVHLVTLLDKPARRRVPVSLLATGFTIPDQFVVGYGLDYRERYRNLPYIGVLDTSGVEGPTRR
jgi:hypoxanthine phosphoribosyltransferase